MLEVGRQALIRTDIVGHVLYSTVQKSTVVWSYRTHRVGAAGGRGVRGRPGAHGAPRAARRLGHAHERGPRAGAASGGAPSAAARARRRTRVPRAQHTARGGRRRRRQELCTCVCVYRVLHSRLSSCDPIGFEIQLLEGCFDGGSMNE